MMGGSRSRGQSFWNAAIAAAFLVVFGAQVSGQDAGGNPIVDTSLVAESLASSYRAERLADDARRERDRFWEEASPGLLVRDVEASASLVGLANFSASMAGKVISITYSDILFEANSDQVSPETTAKVRKLAMVLSRFSGMKLWVEGHTAKLSEADKDDSIALADRRAMSVATLIAGTETFAAAKIETNGRGFYSPIADNTTKDGRALNRRVDISIEVNVVAGSADQAGTVWWKLLSGGKAPGFSAFMLGGIELAELRQALAATRFSGLLVARTEKGVGVLDDRALFLDDGSPTKETRSEQAALAKVLLALDPGTKLRIGGYGSTDSRQSIEERQYLLAYSAVTEAGLPPGALTIGAASNTIALADAGIAEVRLEGAVGGDIALDEGLDGEATVYRASVPYTETEVRLRVTPVDPAATIVYTRGESAQLWVGANEFGFIITSRSKGASIERAYKFLVERADTALTGITTSKGRLEPGFAPDISAYRIFVPYPVRSITLRPEVSEADASSGARAWLLSGSQNALAVGDNRLTVRLVGASGIAKDHEVVVTREAPSTQAALASLTVIGADGRELAVTPPFRGGTAGYDLVLPFAQDRLSIDAKAADGRATVSIDTGAQVDLPVGVREIRVRVTAEDGVTTTEYRLSTRREGPRLSSIGVGKARLEPGFDPRVRSYRIHLPDAADSLAIVPIVDPEDAALGAFVSPRTVLPGAIKVGETRVELVLADKAGPAGSYVLTILRKPARVPSSLESLVAKDGRGETLELRPSFNPSLLSYEVRVPFADRVLSFEVKASDARTTIEMPGLADSLRVGDNERVIWVSASDGQAGTDYRVVVTRERPRLESFSISTAELDPPFDPGIRAYRATVPYLVQSSSLAAAVTAADAAAGASLAGGEGIAGYLAVGETEFVTRLFDGGLDAGDYRVTVARARASTDSALRALRLIDREGLDLELQPAFGEGRTSYEVDVPFGVAEVALAAEAPAGGILSPSFAERTALEVGENHILLEVAAESGADSTSYRILVRRAEAPLAAQPVAMPLAPQIARRAPIEPSYEPFMRPAYSSYTGGTGYTAESGLSLGLVGDEVPDYLRNLTGNVAFHLGKATGNYLDVSAIGAYFALGYAFLPRALVPNLPWFPDLRVTPQIRMGAASIAVHYKNGVYFDDNALLLSPALGLDLELPWLQGLRLGLDVAYDSYFSKFAVQHVSAGLYVGWKFRSGGE